MHRRVTRSVSVDRYEHLKQSDNKFNINNFLLVRKRRLKVKNTVNSESDSDLSPDELINSVKSPRMNEDRDAHNEPTQNSANTSDQCELKQIIINNSDAKMARYNVSTKNRFDGLQNTPETEMETADEENQQEDNGQNKHKLPPPIIMHGQTGNHKGLVNEIKNKVKCDFNIKYTKSNINITINERVERQKLIDHLKSQQLEFHTYTEKAEKTHAFVVRGLASDVEPAELGDELKNAHNIPVVNVYKMKFKKTGQYTPNTLFLLVTDNSVTLRRITAQVKYVLHTRVYFERRRNNRKISQCHNCQNWGHATSNCHAKIKCMYCAGNHNTQSCEHRNQVKCANCNGKHQANDLKCPAYTQRLKWLENNAPQRRQQPSEEHRYNDRDFPRYVPAPTPEQNAWTQRATRQQAATQNHADQEHEPQHEQSHQHRPAAKQPTDRPATFTGKPPTTFQQPTDTFTQLTEQFKILHSMVNISELLRAVTDLNSQIQKCASRTEIFYTFTEFTKQIDHYDI